jgi:hypothetical protein
MEKKEYKKATMEVVTMACEHQLLAGSGGGPAVLGGTSNNPYYLQ